MIADHVPAVRLPPDNAGRRVAAAVPAWGDMENRGDLDPAPPAHHPAAAVSASPESQLGGPGPARDPARRDTEGTPAQDAAAGHPGDDPALAPRPRPPPLGRQVHARQGWLPGDSAEHPGPGPSTGPRNPNGDTAGFTVSWPAWGSRSQRQLSGRSSKPAASTPPCDGPARPGPSSCAPRPRRSWRATSSQPTYSTVPRPTCWP